MKTHACLALLAVAATTVQAADCNNMCTQELAPVCASDGKTYNNKCEFEIAKCKANDATFTIVKDGECSSSSSSGAGTPQCSKEFACLDVYKPVCGSNGVTYSNDCTLKKAQCVEKGILKKGDGECDKSETSTTLPLPTSSSTPSPTTADPTPSSPSTAAPSSQGGSAESDEVCSKACTKEIAYVCGSDGKTYSNACVLEEEKECKSPMLTKVSDGECGGSSLSPDANTAPSTPTTQPNGASGPSPFWAVVVSAVIGWGIAGMF